MPTTQQGLSLRQRAAWFYASRGCLLHSGDVERVTLLINGGRNGLDKRRALFNLAKSVLV
ncbi:hypothetical protein BZY50_04720 [Enterobacter hormaechei]|nr:hypothetical protein BZY50_04720 [Enterobacter hormaechei]